MGQGSAIVQYFVFGHSNSFEKKIFSSNFVFGQSLEAKQWACFCAHAMCHPCFAFAFSYVNDGQFSFVVPLYWYSESSRTFFKKKLLRTELWHMNYSRFWPVMEILTNFAIFFEFHQHWLIDGLWSMMPDWLMDYGVYIVHQSVISLFRHSGSDSHSSILIYTFWTLFRFTIALNPQNQKTSFHFSLSSPFSNLAIASEPTLPPYQLSSSSLGRRAAIQVDFKGLKVRLCLARKNS